MGCCDIFFSFVYFSFLGLGFTFNLFLKTHFLFWACVATYAVFISNLSPVFAATHYLPRRVRAYAPAGARLGACRRPPTRVAWPLARGLAPPEPLGRPLAWA